ncbi:hypothetical protein ACFFWD_02810 [Bradyrhizobium erythrophlei]
MSQPVLHNKSGMPASAASASCSIRLCLIRGNPARALMGARAGEEAAKRRTSHGRKSGADMRLAVQRAAEDFVEITRQHGGKDGRSFDESSIAEAHLFTGRAVTGRSGPQRGPVFASAKRRRRRPSLPSGLRRRPSVPPYGTPKVECHALMPAAYPEATRCVAQSQTDHLLGKIALARRANFGNMEGNICRMHSTGGQ